MLKQPRKTKKEKKGFRKCVREVVYKGVKVRVQWSNRSISCYMQIRDIYFSKSIKDIIVDSGHVDAMILTAQQAIDKHLGLETPKLALSSTD